MKRILLLGMLISAPCLGQGVIDRFIVVPSSKSVPSSTQAPVLTFPNTRVRICPFSPPGPCSSKAKLFNDQIVTETNSKSMQANLKVRYGFWVAQGIPQPQNPVSRNIIAPSLSSTAGLQGSGEKSVNSMAYVNGNGTADNTAAIQAVVNACTAGTICGIELNNVVIAGSIKIPNTSDYNFTGPLGVKCTGLGVNCFERDLVSGTALFRVRFTGMKFVKSNTGACIADLMIFSSAGNQGMTVDHNFFILTGSAIGFLTQGSTQNIISSNSFSSFTEAAHVGADRSGVAIQTQGAFGSYGPMGTTVADNNFNYLTAIKPNIVVGANDAWEGWSIHNNNFAVATITLQSGDAINLSGNTFVNADLTILGNFFNSYILGNYFDSNIMRANMILVHPTLGQIAALQIQNNHFELSAGPNQTGIHFQNGGNLVTGVTVTGNNYSSISPSKSSSFSISSNIVTLVTPNSFSPGEMVVPTGFTIGTYLNDQGLTVISAAPSQFTAAFTHADVTSTADRGTIFPVSYGVWFQDNNLRNLYLGAENFRLTWAALQFSQTLDRSTIESFEARDVSYYANGLDSNRGSYLRADHLYFIEPVHASAYLPSSGASIDFAHVWVPHPSMFPGFIPSLSTNMCNPGISATLSAGANGASIVVLHATNVIPVGLYACDVTMTFDGTKYVPPR